HPWLRVSQYADASKAASAMRTGPRSPPRLQARRSATRPGVTGLSDRLLVDADPIDGDGGDFSFCLLFDANLQLVDRRPCLLLELPGDLRDVHGDVNAVPAVLAVRSGRLLQPEQSDRHRIGRVLG